MNVCQECGKFCESSEFHDYVECIRNRAANNLFLFSDVQSLLAYIDVMQPERKRGISCTCGRSHAANCPAYVDPHPFYGGHAI